MSSDRRVPQPIRVATHAYERSVIVVCSKCPHTVEAKIRASYELPDEICDQRLDRDLRAEGWRVDADGETCPECVGRDE